jgi:serine/threonine protein kinase
VTDFVVDRDTAFLVMELLDGQSLAGILHESSSPSATWITHVGLQVLEALDVAHRAGLVHRDVKPDNIFLVDSTNRPFAKLLDFGLVRVVHDDGPKLTEAGTVLGTWSYMAPEQGWGTVVDARADIYALGACLYHALSGKRPHDAAGMEAGMFALSPLPAPPLAEVRPDIDERLAAVIDRALSKDPARRWSSAEAMAKALARCLSTSRERHLSSRALREVRGGQGAPRLALLAPPVHPAHDTPTASTGLEAGGPDPTSRPLAHPWDRLAFGPTVADETHEPRTLERVAVPTLESGHVRRRTSRTGECASFFLAGLAIFAIGVAVGRLLFMH